MRIVSFLPSATEILFALGLAEQVVAVTFECDYPPDARRLPQVVHSHLPADLSPSAIDTLVASAGQEGRSLYFADMPLLERLAPDLILLQDLCHVCAIDSPTLARDLSQLPSRPEVLSLSARTLGGVLEDIGRVGAATDASAAASRVTAALRERIYQVSCLPPLPVRPRVLALEWLDPFFQGGHWIPEMIYIAGGEPVLAVAGEKSVRLTSEQVLAANPDVIVLMPCGYDLPQTVEQYRHMARTRQWEQLRAVREDRVYAVDGSAYFSRPGPRLVEGVESLAALLRGLPGRYLRVR